MNEWINYVFDVGMLQTMQGGPCLTFSPDAIELGTIQSKIACLRRRRDR